MEFGFEWDEAKAAINERKHGVSFVEAMSAFHDPLSLTIPDPDHSSAEDRFVLIGETERDRVIVVVHALRGETIRIISARPATRSERATREEA
jgi:hypothetical protein